MVLAQKRDAVAQAPGCAVQPVVRVVGPNPAMDRTEQIGDLRLNQVNRAVVSSPRAGGKSLIVARALRRLGHDVAAYGFLGGPIGQYLREECAGLGIRDCHTEIAGDTRINTILVDQRTHQSTVINEPGPVITAEEITRLTATLRADLRKDELLILTGSIPRGVGEELYAALISLARDIGAKTIVDAEGPALRAAIDAGPWAVKCNLQEFVGIFPEAPAELRDDADRALLRSTMRAVVDSGVELVIVTLGALGLLAVTATHLYEVQAAEVETRNATGSGDTFLAGFASSFSADHDLGLALRTGAAAASANAAVMIPDIGVNADIDGLLARTGMRIRSLTDTALSEVAEPLSALP